MTNGLMHTGYIDLGDLDVWTVSANAGDSIVVRMGDMTNSTLSPALWIYGPNGALLGADSAGAVAAEVSFRATNSGTFLVVAGDFSAGYLGRGAYRLTLAKTGDPVLVSAGDEGGRMTNGLMHTGIIDVGDLDVWYFTANSGENIVVRMGETVTPSTLSPWLRLYGPNGALLSSVADGATSAEVFARATNSGTFIVVAADFSAGYSGSGAYRLTLAKTGEPFAVSPGDEGGPMNGGNGYTGTIDVGDIDAFNFTACDGDFVVLQLYEVITNSTLTPWLRLYGRDGALLGSVAAATATQLSIRATNSGAFTVLVTDDSPGYSGTGAYQLTVNGLSFDMKLCIPVISGANVAIGGVGGVSNATFILYSQTNITAPFATWTPLLTNQFDGFGVFNRTNLSRADPQRFYRLCAPFP